MRSASPKVGERHKKIRELLLQNGHLTVMQLCSMLDCSEATIRNDLTALEKQDYVRRVYGGAVATGNTTNQIDFSFRENIKTAKKKKLARYVVDTFIREGQHVFLDTGTTMMEVARELAKQSIPVTVLTHSLDVATILSVCPDIQLYTTGGCYYRTDGGFFGNITDSTLDQFLADVMIFCPAGVSAQVGLTVPEPHIAAVKQKMFLRSSKVISIADHSKIDRRAFSLICPVSRPDYLVIDDGLSEEDAGRLRLAGARLTLCH